MATAAAFSLSVPHEDTMDMSSPAHRGHEDIDIDFDEPAIDYTVSDEHMNEDGDLRPSTATDAEMDDDMNREATFVHEEEMSDQLPSEQDRNLVEDDELIDYDDDDYQDDTQIAEGIQQNGADAEHSSGPNPAIVHNALSNEVQQPAGSDTIPRSDVASLETDTVSLEPIAQADEHARSDDATENTADILHPAGDCKEYPEDLDGQSETAELAEETGTAHAGAVEPSISLATDVPALVDGPGTPTDTGLHPVTLRHNEAEMPLFKSKHQPGGLLEDDNLANLSLAELMQKCKERLVLKGEEISSDREVVLGFDSFPLMLYESSRSAYDCSLNDVLETYLQLHRNDGISDIPPMSLTLTLQIKFKNSLDFFKHMAETGQGISSVAALQIHSVEGFPEEYAEDDEINYEDDQQEDEYKYEPEDYTGSEYHEDGNEYQEDEYDNQQVDNVEDGPSRTSLDGPEASENEAAKDFARQEPDEEEHVEAQPSTAYTPSPSSSNTLRDNTDHNAADGEYDQEDYIDWDVDLMTHELDESAVRGGDSTDSIDLAQTANPKAGHSDAETAEQLHEHEDYAHQELIPRPGQEWDQDEQYADGEVSDKQQQDLPLEEDHDELHPVYDFQTEFDEHVQGDEHESVAVVAATEPAKEVETSALDELLDLDYDETTATEDLIDFDDDTTEQHEARKASKAPLTKATSTKSPQVKRSFDDQADEDELDFDDEPESKKVRAQ